MSVCTHKTCIVNVELITWVFVHQTLSILKSHFQISLTKVHTQVQCWVRRSLRCITLLRALLCTNHCKSKEPVTLTLVSNVPSVETASIPTQIRLKVSRDNLQSSTALPQGASFLPCALDITWVGIKQSKELEKDLSLFLTSYVISGTQPCLCLSSALKELNKMVSKALWISEMSFFICPTPYMGL